MWKRPERSFVSLWVWAMVLQILFCVWVRQQGGYAFIPVEVFGLCQWLPGCLALVYAGRSQWQLLASSWRGVPWMAVLAWLFAMTVVVCATRLGVLAGLALPNLDAWPALYPMAYYFPDAWLRTDRFWIVLVTIAPGLHLLNAAAEEWLWRGVLLDRMDGSMPRAWVPWVAGLLWGLWHVPMVLLLDWAFPGQPIRGAIVFVIGLTLWGGALVQLRWSTQGLLAPIVMHATFNAWMVGYFNLQLDQGLAWYISPWGPFGWCMAVLFLVLLHHVRPDGNGKSILQRLSSPHSRQLVLPNGQRLHYVDQGQPDQPALLLIHGFMASLFDYDDCAARLSVNWRVIRLDMPGMGLSGGGERVRLDEAYKANCLIGLMDHLGVQRATLVGHSLGGYAAWTTTLFHPTRVERLVLISAAGLKQGQEPTRAPLSFRLGSIRWLKPMVRYMAAPWLVRLTLRSLVKHPSWVTAAWIRRAFWLTLFPGNRITFVRLRPFRDRPDLVGRLHEIQVPTLVVWGADDQLIPVRHAHYFAKAIPGAEMAVYLEVGHYPIVEAVDQLVRDMNRFFNKTKGDANV